MFVAAGIARRGMVLNVWVQFYYTCFYNLIVVVDVDPLAALPL